MSAAKEPENEVKGLRRSTRRRSTSTIDSEELDTPKTRRTTRQSTGLLDQVLEESTIKSDIETKSESEVRPARRLSRRNSDVTIDSPTVSSLRLLRTRIVDTTASDTPKKTRTRRTTLGNIHEEGQNDTPKRTTDTPKKEIGSKVTKENIENKTDTPIPPKRASDGDDMPEKKSPKLENNESKIIKESAKEEIEVTPVTQNSLTPILEVKKKLRSSLGLGSDNESEKTPQCNKLEEKDEETPVNIAKSAEEIKRKLRPSLSICQPDETIIEDKEVVENKVVIVTPAKISSLSFGSPEKCETDCYELEHLYLSEQDESNSPKKNRPSIILSEESKTNQKDFETLTTKLPLRDSQQESLNSSQSKKNLEEPLKTPKSAVASELSEETSVPRKLRSSLSSSQQDSPSEHEQSLPSSPSKSSPMKGLQSMISSPAASISSIVANIPSSPSKSSPMKGQQSVISSPEPSISSIDVNIDEDSTSSVSTTKSEEAKKLQNSTPVKTPKSVTTKRLNDSNAELSSSQAEDSCESAALIGTPVNSPKSQESIRLRSSLSTSKSEAEKLQSEVKNSSSPVKNRNATPVNTPKSEEIKELRSPLSTFKGEAEKSDIANSPSPLKLSRNASPMNTPRSEEIRELRSSLKKAEVEKSHIDDSSSPPKLSRNTTPVSTPKSDEVRELPSSLNASKPEVETSETRAEDSFSPLHFPSRDATPLNTPTSESSRRLRSSINISTVEVENPDTGNLDPKSSPKRSRNATPVNTPTSDARRPLRSSLSTSKATTGVDQAEDSDSSSPPRRSRSATPVNTPTSEATRQLRSSLSTSKVTSEVEKLDNQVEDSHSPPKRSRNATPVKTPTSHEKTSLSTSTSEAQKVDTQAEDSDSSSPPKRSRNATPVKTPISDENKRLQTSSKAEAENTNVTPVKTPVTEEGRKLRSSLSTSKVDSEMLNSTPKPVTPITACKAPEIEISPFVKCSDENGKRNSFSVLHEQNAMSSQGSPGRVLRSSLAKSQPKLVVEECSKMTPTKGAVIDLDDSEIEFRQTPLRLFNRNVKFINTSKQENLVEPSSGVEEAVGSSSANQSMQDNTMDLMQKSAGSDKENEILNVTGASNLNESTQEDKSISQESTQDEPDFNKSKDLANQSEDSKLPNTPAKGGEDVLELRQRSIIKTPTSSPITKTDSETTSYRLVLEESPKPKSITAEESDDELMNSFVNRPNSPLETEAKNPIATGSPGLMISATPANTPVQKRLSKQLSPGKKSPKPVSSIEEISSDEEDLALTQKGLSAEKLNVLSDCDEKADKNIRQRAKSLPGDSSKKVTPPIQSKNISSVELCDSDGSGSTYILLTPSKNVPRKGELTNGDAKFSSDEEDDANVLEDNDSNSDDRSYICTDEESDQNSLIDDEAMENSGSDMPSDGSNDIIEVGESLKGSSSDEEDEDDEYENDSFIVSDPEDPELLSGTGDDLSSAESDIEIISQSKAAKQAFNKQKQYKRVKPITLDSSDDEEAEEPTQKRTPQVISSDDDEKDTQKSNQPISSDDDEESDAVLENSVFLPDAVEEEEDDDEIENRTVVLDKSPSFKAKQQEIKENSIVMLEESEKSHKNLRNNQEKSPGTKLKNESCEEVILRRVTYDVGNESVIILEPTPEIKKKKSKKGRKKSIEAQERLEEEEIDGEVAPQLVKSPLIKKKKGKKGIKNIEINDSPKPDPQQKPQDSPKQKKKNKKSKRISIEAIKSPELTLENSPLVKKSPGKFVEEPIQKKSPIIQKKKSRKDRKNVSNLEIDDEKSGSKIHLVALNTKGKIPCLPISLLEELPVTSPELPEITLPEKKNKKRKLQPETVNCKKSKQLQDGLEIVSLSKFMLPSSSGFTSCGFKEEMLNRNRIPRQSSIQLLNKNLKKESLKRKW